LSFGISYPLETLGRYSCFIPIHPVSLGVGLVLDGKLSLNAPAEKMEFATNCDIGFP
jgi:hypothetical protein